MRPCNRWRSYASHMFAQRPDDAQEAESRWRLPTEDFDAAAGFEVAVRDAKAMTCWCMDHQNNVLWTGKTHSVMLLTVPAPVPCWRCPSDVTCPLIASLSLHSGAGAGPLATRACIHNAYVLHHMRARHAGHADGKVSGFVLPADPGRLAARSVTFQAFSKNSAVSAICASPWGQLWTGNSRGSIR